MSEYHEVACEVCKKEFQIAKWSEGACPSCGAVHEWDEGYALQLEPPTVAAIISHFGAKP
jgi:Zn finger protein HypA/HybF involved in hydrogenase expression